MERLLRGNGMETLMFSPRNGRGAFVPSLNASAASLSASFVQQTAHGSLLANLPHKAVVTTDHAGRILVVNKMAAQLFGLEPHALVGRALPSLLAARPLASTATATAQVLASFAFFFFLSFPDVSKRVSQDGVVAARRRRARHAGTGQHGWARAAGPPCQRRAIPRVSVGQTAHGRGRPAPGGRR
jgi:PAS domain-containing protein